MKTFISAIALLAVAQLAFTGPAEARRRAKCEMSTATASAPGPAMARQLAMQQLVEAIRDTGRKPRGKITYVCRTQVATTCTARQRTCR